MLPPDVEYLIWKKYMSIHVLNELKQSFEFKPLHSCLNRIKKPIFDYMREAALWSHHYVNSYPSEYYPSFRGEIELYEKYKRSLETPSKHAWVGDITFRTKRSDSTELLLELSSIYERVSVNDLGHVRIELSRGESELEHLYCVVGEEVTCFYDDLGRQSKHFMMRFWSMNSSSIGAYRPSHENGLIPWFFYLC